MQLTPTVNIQEIKNAASFLRGWYSEQKEEAELILNVVVEEGGAKWYVPYHSFWGMKIRNLLRANGYTEKVLGVRNLDDIYHVLVKHAVLTMDYCLDVYFVRLEELLERGVLQAIALSEEFYQKQGV